MKSFPKIIFVLLITFWVSQTLAQKSSKDSLENGNPPSSSKEKFMFLINSDPQMGDENTKLDSLKILNTLLEQFVEETLARSKRESPDFIVWNGDLVWQPLQNAFDNFNRIISQLKVPSVLVHGNHDGVKDDPKFLNLQQDISGYRKLNYSFDYGKWHFVVIAAQEKYLSKNKKAKLLAWLDKELKENKDKHTMLFMHYHILPTGLSQTEYYTYFPMTFKNDLLDTITRYNNVKYVFSGHVHIGIKASVKTARTYKGTNFILSPTPVFARPFGEEYEEYKTNKSRYNNRGFYMEVHVDGDQVELIGRKINHPFKVKYPNTFTKFTKENDKRSFTPEGMLEISKTLTNGDFKNGLDGWNSSWRYQTDKKPVFTNVSRNGKSILRYVAKYGSWNYDEYMENYQVIKYHKDLHLSINFNTLPNNNKGSGSYFRIFAYDKNGKLLKILLFHWGTDEEKVNYMHQSWAYNAIGDRKHPLWLDNEIKQGNMLSYTLSIEPLKTHILDIQISDLFKLISDSESFNNINHLAFAYGVWGRVNKKGKQFTSILNVNEVSISSTNNKHEYSSSVMMDNRTINITDKQVNYGQIFRDMANKKRKNKNK